ncbi:MULTISPECIES: exodeoxyribonuclease VII small subunit [Pseudothermotoga]|uniref:exodeoxyribonuclease VII small subunit n=1 Tax=Pseudothermotoga TaxID=1643951 RepID=UPI000AAEB1B2|nr:MULTISPECIES: exodeoxyribonuclease VII small subunit [Pseudothermotoga]HBJ81495.1 exodeoxyribonuclease VII small subunit [Pseudothermotoga sp.]
MKIDEMIRELESIVIRLESEDLSFDEAFMLYEKGAEIYRKLHQALEDAKLKVQDIYLKMHNREDENVEY